MADPFYPTLVSEREPDGSWEDCTWCSGVMLGNFMRGRDQYPATRAEYEGLRVDGGEKNAEGSGDGSNYGQLRAGMARRYALKPSEVSGPGFIDVGQGAGIQGLYSKLPARLQVTNFKGAHSVFAIRLTADRYAWFDPLQAKGASSVMATHKEVVAYFCGLNGASVLVGDTEAGGGDSMIKLNFQRWQATAETPVYPDAAESTRVSTIPKGTVFTTIGFPMDRSEDSTPGLDAAWRAAYVTSKAFDNLAGEKVGYVKTATLKAVTTSAEWDAALFKAMVDPDFRGETTVEIPVNDAVLIARVKELEELVEKAAGANGLIAERLTSALGEHA